MPTTPPPDTVIYQGEDAELSGGASVETTNKGFTGKGYVAGYIDSGTAATTFSVKVSTPSGFYTSRQVVRFVGPVFKRFNKKYKTIPLLLLT